MTLSILTGPAGPEDLPEVHRMLVALAAETGTQARITPAGLAALASGAAQVLVARLTASPARHPVGYALVLRRPEAVKGGQEHEIAQLYVQPPFRGQGIGRALIGRAGDLARAEASLGLTLRLPGVSGAAELGAALGLRAVAPAYAVSLTPDPSTTATG